MAGVAAGRLDDRPSGSQQAVAFGGFDHREPDAVLDRAAWVEHLELGQQQRLSFARTQVACHSIDPDEGRPADEIEDGSGVLHRRGV
jgi:hypothetical protein